MKYIVIKHKYGGDLSVESPIIFPDRLVHLLVAETMLNSSFLDFKGAKVISAGTVDLMGVSCSGHSTSIEPKVVSRGRADELLIQLNDYGMGIS